MPTIINAIDRDALREQVRRANPFPHVKIEPFLDNAFAHRVSEAFPSYQDAIKVGQSFFEPPGAVHLVSANASNTEPAELIAVFVADEGAQLTTFVE